MSRVEMQVIVSKGWIIPRLKVKEWWSSMLTVGEETVMIVEIDMIDIEIEEIDIDPVIHQKEVK